MCLLTTQPEGTVFDTDFISGVYRLNSDGIGVMYAENNVLHIRKSVPKTEKEFVDFFEKNINGRACSWHARMRTHGEIDMDNCHPYEVLSEQDGYPLYLAHNGVLSTGNSADKSKSDTWHYIRDYLRPMLLKNPEFFMTEAFAKIIGSHIGSGNKFVLMDAYGNMATVNKSAGVTHNGAWLSNTYAWDTTGTPFDIPVRQYGGGRFQGYNNYQYDRLYSQRSLYSGLGDDNGYDYFYGTSGQSTQEKGKAQSQAQGETNQAAGNVIQLPSTLKNSAPNPEADRIDFCIDFFYAIRQLEYVELDAIMPWVSAELYYDKVGHEQAWGILDAIELGAYTEHELMAEFHAYGLLDFDDSEEDAALKAELEKIAQEKVEEETPVFATA